jgi:hypothetical protein
MSEQIINVELLRRVKAHILAEPSRFDMGEFIIEGDAARTFAVKFDRPAPPCGTIACIAGWAVLLSDDDPPSDAEEIELRANALLGLTPEMGDRLFFTTEWPERFKQSYREAEDSDLAVAALVAAERVEHFIKTKGAE